MSQHSPKLAAIVEADSDGSPAPRQAARVINLNEHRPVRARPDRELPRLHLEHWLIGALLLASYALAVSAFI